MPFKNTGKYKKCMDCDFFENRCYVNPESVVSVCNKYHCCTSPESTCLTHKKHNHRNYDPELYASSAGRKHAVGLSPPFRCVNTTRPTATKAQRASSPLQRNGLSPPTSSEPTPEEIIE